MRRVWFRTAVGLALTPLLGLGLLPGAEPAKDGKPVPPQPSLVTEKEQTCGSYGTKIEFVASPSDAAKLAKKENKLVFILHVSGHFEDPKFT
jgi:hypothetical protein